MSAPKQLVVRTIDLDKHFDIAYQFRKETFWASFGHADNFMGESVSPTNQTALAFYTRQGWKDCGPRPNKPVHLMEKLLES